ncbi:MAG TPA: WecB/TagA/CpsF family glycosyltransferase [Rhizomicrobium sp.]|jgi:exopolysaccharide biosynthesis WecB/TagA/CpsF family protein
MSRAAVPTREDDAKSYAEIRAGGLRVACLGRNELKALMVRECREARMRTQKTPKLVFAANGHAISLAARDSEFRRFHEVADLIHADGQPVVFASRLLARTPIPERSATTDFFHDAAEAACRHGLRFFLLGATEEVNAACAERMRVLHPGLQIAGRRHGYFRREDEARICAEINAAKPDVLWVGLGLPLEQAFCVRNRDRLSAGWMVTAGGCFNFVAGNYARAPEWMQRTGFEWLHRLAHEPRRLFGRYALTNPHALFLLLTRTSALEQPMSLRAKAAMHAESPAG